MIRSRKFFALAGMALVAALAACGGGGGGSSVPSNVAGGSSASSTPTPGVSPTSTPIALASGEALAQFSITLPSTGTAATARRPQYVDPATKSITMTLLTVNGVAVSGSTVQGPYNLQAGQTGCVTTTTTTCTFSIAAPIGTDVFVANTYSALNALSTSALGSGAVSMNVLANATNAANLTLTGPVSTALIVSNNAANSDTLWDGNGVFAPYTYADYVTYQNSDGKVRLTPQRVAPLSLVTSVLSERLFVIAEDSQGNTIFNPTSYNQPITLTLSLRGGTPSNSTLTDTPPAGLGCGAATSTSVDGGTVTVCSPFDVITLSLIPNVPSTFFSYYTIDYNFPYITTTLPAGTTTFPYTVEATQPTPPPNTGNLPVVVQ